MFYFKNLDGLRAIAAFAVVFCHVGNWIPFPQSSSYNALNYLMTFGDKGGELGVTFFFILSGFLITYLMFKEKEELGKLNVPLFYYRRFLRIWPLYFGTLLVGFFLYPMIASMLGHSYVENASGFLYSIFAVNYDHIFHGGPSCGILGVQWSVAIEEQFYLIWPLVFLVLTRKNTIVFFVSFFVLSEIYFLSAKNWEVGYYHLFSNFRFLTFGGLLAYFCFFKESDVKQIFRLIPKSIHMMIYFFCFFLLLFQYQLINQISYIKYLVHPLPILFFSFVIVEQNFSENSFFKVGNYSWLTWLGKISYGLYLTHMIAIYIVLSFFPANSGEYLLLKIIVTVALTIIISSVSYKYFESFFLRLKRGVSPLLVKEAK